MTVTINKNKPTRDDLPREAGPFWFDGGAIPIALCFCPDQECWDYAFATLECTVAPGLYPSSAGMCTTLDREITNSIEPVCIITMNVTPSMVGSQIVGILAHEAVHVMQHAIDSMYPNRVTERHMELEAYIVQWAAQACYYSYRDWEAYKATLTKKKKKKKK
jgi:hypothetical protein